jgi:hypothetical protein
MEMKVGRMMLAATLIASVSTGLVAQGRGGAPPRRGDAMTEQQRQSIRELRQRHEREMSELRTRHRNQMERALPPEARRRMEQRRGDLMREGRMLERRQMLRQRGRDMQQRDALGGRGPGMRPPERLMGPRGRGNLLPPDSGAIRGRGRGGR